MYVRKIKGVDPDVLASEISSTFKKAGYNNIINKKGKSGFSISDIRLSEAYVKKYGRNVNDFSGIRGRYLGWDNWVEVNNLINKVVDKFHAEAKVDSLGGKFKIREGKRRYTEDDWEDIKYERGMNVWKPEKSIAFSKLQGIV